MPTTARDWIIRQIWILTNCRVCGPHGPSILKGENLQAGVGVMACMWLLEEQYTL